MGASVPFSPVVGVLLCGVRTVPEFNKTAHLSEHGEASSMLAGGNFAGTIATPSREERAERHWYALRTYPRHEKGVRERLQSRSVECFLPLFEQTRKWKNGQKMRVELPLFPGYLFVEIDPARRAHVLEIPGAISLVGSQHELWPVSDSQIQMLRDDLHLRKFEPYTYLSAGQKVRIKSGPLANLTGILIRKNSSLRVVLTLDQIMQGVAVEVDACEVEPLNLCANTTDPS